jgi:hypothetical protein
VLPWFDYPIGAAAAEAAAVSRLASSIMGITPLDYGKGRLPQTIQMRAYQNQDLCQFLNIIFN